MTKNEVATAAQVAKKLEYYFVPNPDPKIGSIEAKVNKQLGIECDKQKL